MKEKIKFKNWNIIFDFFDIRFYGDSKYQSLWITYKPRLVYIEQNNYYKYDKYDECVLHYGSSSNRILLDEYDHPLLQKVLYSYHIKDIDEFGSFLSCFDTLILKLL